MPTGKIQNPASHDYTNVIMDSTVLNNNVHVHDIVHWEIWKNNQSISNMEAIDNKVQFFFLINSPTYYFIQINIKTNVVPPMG